MESSSSNEIQLGTVGGGEETAVMLEAEESIRCMRKIQRIPAFLRSKKGNSCGGEDDDDYDPKVVSIGPYHHGKPELQLLQELKHKVLNNFIVSDDTHRDAANFYRNTVLQVVDKARRCYDDGSTDEFDDSQFADMMLLDACFLLNDILLVMDDVDVFKHSITFLHEQIGISGYIFIRVDMILLENQIPLWIVELLFNARYGNTRIGNISWKQRLIKYCQLSYSRVEYKEDEDILPHEPLHILQVFHMQMVYNSHSSPSGEGDCGCWPKILPRTEKNSTIMKLQNDGFEKYGYIFRSVMDLKSKGIHFGRSDNIHSVLSIRFESNQLYAKLKLPIWCATSLSRVFFTNIIAYELCSNSYTQLEVISYINFMKSLIVCPNDVKELREKRIIHNTLGDDMEVVQLFKGLNTHGIDNPNIFKEVKQKIQKHYDNPKKTWMAEFIYTYLISPWSVIALLAACVLLVLTFAQAYAAFKWHN